MRANSQNKAAILGSFILAYKCKLNSFEIFFGNWRLNAGAQQINAGLTLDMSELCTKTSACSNISRKHDPLMAFTASLIIG
jgi:hypothetical protein